MIDKSWSIRKNPSRTNEQTIMVLKKTDARYSSVKMMIENKDNE